HESARPSRAADDRAADDVHAALPKASRAPGPHRHDHLFDHFVERYSADGKTYRIDALVTGGGGAPKYSYAGEPDLRAYMAAGASENVRVEHLMKPGIAPDNQHHFVVVQVDGDKFSLEVVGSGP